MAKQKNPNIGAINCPICGRACAVRKSTAAKYYFDCLACGRITPNMPMGQNWILENARIWGQGKPPAGTPDWIANDLPWREAVIAEGIQKPAPAAPVAGAPPPRVPDPAPPPAPGHLPPPPPEPAGPPEPQQRGAGGGFAFFE